jgi:signal peptidase II
LPHRRFRDLLVLGVAILVLVADQLTKAWVRRNLLFGVPWQPVSWLRPIFSFTYITNTGAAFGLFPQLGRLYAFVALTVIGILFYFYRNLVPSTWLTSVSLGLQLGGALGNNVVDRLWHGRVTDFLDLNFWPLHEWPVFNVADSSIVVGTCILAAYLLLQKEPPTTKAPASDGQQTP